LTVLVESLMCSLGHKDFILNSARARTGFWSPGAFVSLLLYGLWGHDSPFLFLTLSSFFSSLSFRDPFWTSPPRPPALCPRGTFRRRSPPPHAGVQVRSLSFSAEDGRFLRLNVSCILGPVFAVPGNFLHFPLT